MQIVGKSGSIRAQVKNISQTGACLELETGAELALKKGDLLTVTIVLINLNKTHNMNAEVIWTSDNKTGVQFVDPTQVMARLMKRAAS